MWKKIKQSLEKAFGYCAVILRVSIPLHLIAAFLYGIFGAQTYKSSSFIVNAVWALIKYPIMLLELVTGLMIVAILIGALMYDIASKKYKLMLPKAIGIILLYCFALVLVEHVGSVVAHNLLLIILAAVGLTIASGATVMVLSSSGAILFTGAFGLTTFFAEIASIVMSFVLAVTAVSIIWDTILSFF